MMSVRDRDRVEASQKHYKDEQILHVGAAYTVHVGGRGKGDTVSE